MAGQEMITMTFDARKAARALGLYTRKQQRAFLAGAHRALVAAGVEIHRRASADILKAGNFSARWPAALQENVQQGQGVSTMQVGFSSAIPYAHVHELGSTIRGKPLLWIPLPWNPHQVRAREYPGRLFRVERPGRNPLLFSRDTKEAAYVGVTHVTLRPRFHIRSIVANVVRTALSKYFATFVKGVRL